MNWLHLSVVVLALLGVSDAEGDYAPSSGRRVACPSPRVVPDFDLTRYTGQWFQYQNFPNPFEVGVVCNMIEFTKINDAELQVVNSGLLVVNNDGVEKREPIEFMGTVTPFEPVAPGEPQPGKLFVNLTVPGRPPRLTPSPNYCVVDTDYDNFAVIYFCRLTNDGTAISEQSSIITRERGKEPENLEKILSKLRRNGVADPRDKFVVTEQTNCVATEH